MREHLDYDCAGTPTSNFFDPEARATTIVAHLDAHQWPDSIIDLIGKNEADEVTAVIAALLADTSVQQHRTTATQAALRRHFGLSATWLGRLLGFTPNKKALDEYIDTATRSVVHAQQSMAVRGHDLQEAIIGLRGSVSVAERVADCAPDRSTKAASNARALTLVQLLSVALQNAASLSAGNLSLIASANKLRSARAQRDAAHTMAAITSKIRST